VTGICYSSSHVEISEHSFIGLVRSDFFLFFLWFLLYSWADKTLRQSSKIPFICTAESFFAPGRAYRFEIIFVLQRFQLKRKASNPIINTGK